jgi:zeaxanthin glucosyltransferase
MKIAFVAPPVTGHLNPMNALARRLRSRGHDVVFIATPDGEQIIRAAGIPFIPFCEERYPAGQLAEIVKQMGQLQGQEGLEFAASAVARIVEASFDDLPRTLLKHGVDAVVLDEIMWNLGLVPMHLGIPYAHVSNALHFDFLGSSPLCVYGWPHETSADALSRNREGALAYKQINERSTEVARSYARRAGMDIDWNDPFATISKLAWLSQTPREFDFKEIEMPQQFHHVGPLHEESGRMKSNFPWHELPGEPLIYASMGTIQNGLETVFNTIAEAVGDRAGMQLVLSTGPVVDPQQIKSVPANAIVVQSAPQLRLLKRSVLCITHAGLNTVLESLTQGVPMVAIPVTNDQPGVAARIAYTKTGAILPIQELEVPKLRSLIDDVLSNREYAKNAQRLKRAIAMEDGLENAANVLEEAFSTTPPGIGVASAGHRGLQ